MGIAKWNREMEPQNLIIDCFAGGGGTSVGIDMGLGRPVDIAVNHDPAAILMHKTNHPYTLHLTEDIFRVDLKKYVNGRHVALMWASPDCTHFSKAKGRKPLKKEIRMLPMAVVQHAKAVKPDVIIMENVEEIRQWGPLNKKGYPILMKKGKSYQNFLKKMYLAGYTKIESRELVAADYGAPTIRKRWYAVFRRDGRDIVWPEPTHSKNGENCLLPWEPIYKYLDFSNLGKSIFDRKKPLAENTLNRIARGLEKFVFNNPEPFIVQVNHSGSGFRGQSVHDVLPTITSKHGYGLITPIIIQYHSETTKSGVRGQDVRMPIQTIDTSNRYALVSSFLTKFYKSGIGQRLQEPIHTITTSPGHFGLVSIAAVNWNELQKAGIDEETAKRCTWVSNFIMEYYGCGTGQAVTEPIHTIVTKERFALITVLGNEYAIMDIYLRMLTPEELKLGQGFPRDYIIDRDYNWKPYPISKQVARIGNSVVPIMAEKLVKANCPYLIVGERIPNFRIEEEASGQIRFA